MFEYDPYKKAFDDIHASERVQTEVLKMISGNKSYTRRITGKKAVLLVAAAFLILALGMAAYGAITWNGFALTGDLRKPTVDKMLEDYSAATSIGLIEPDGTVHYLDRQGNEIMVLTAEEAERYEREQREAREDAVRGSTTLIDADTLSVIPNSITELNTGADGAIPDFALGNGHMVLFCGADKSCFSLEAGESMILTLTSNDECFLVYYVFRDGVLLAEGNDVSRMRSHSFSYAVEESGSYCIGLMYASVTASNFTGGSIRFGQTG